MRDRDNELAIEKKKKYDNHDDRQQSTDYIYLWTKKMYIRFFARRWYNFDRRLFYFVFRGKTGQAKNQNHDKYDEKKMLKNKNDGKVENRTHSRARACT